MAASGVEFDALLADCEGCLQPFADAFGLARFRTIIYEADMGAESPDGPGRRRKVLDVVWSDGLWGSVSILGAIYIVLLYINRLLILVCIEVCLNVLWCMVECCSVQIVNLH